MESNIQIFDKDGKQLNINLVIAEFLKEQAVKHELDATDITVGVDFVDDVAEETTLMLYNDDYLTLNRTVINDKKQ